VPYATHLIAVLGTHAKRIEADRLERRMETLEQTLETRIESTN